MDHPEKATRKRKPKPNAQTSAPPSLPISSSLAAQPTAAPGAIPDSGTGTELEALRRTQSEKETVSIEADGVASKTLASRLGARNLGIGDPGPAAPVYDASIAPAAEGLTLSDPLNDVTHEFDTTTKALTEVAPADLRDETLEQGTLARIAAKFDPEVPAFQGIKMEEVPPGQHRRTGRTAWPSSSSTAGARRSQPSRVLCPGPGPDRPGGSGHR